MNLLFWITAGIPILFLLVVIMKFGWSVSKAAPVGMFLAGITAVYVYRSTLPALCLEAGKGFWNAATLIIFFFIFTSPFSFFDSSKRWKTDAQHSIKQAIDSERQ